ncbi:helix-turn-helix domain-containing protein [Lactococcus insecticola]|uniref:PucR C-terminal helix-turn-helix domain-containing protein n=1 Tax=Pseudolactococcus insecticola TaxID=2709158 RepID=A0A6A0B761_9LACT|nr:helix-turn-helix domain-containing protein [Lactococcus insecticola]GFH40331.1 hypothetical protein Hs20B_07290 [Lactococcus insecticola]
MNIQELMKLYPVKSGQGQATAENSQTFFDFENDGQHYYIEKSDLTTREQLLFERVLFADVSLTDFEHLTAGTYRLIQLRSANFDDLSENLSLILPELREIKKISQDSGYAIERLSQDHLSEFELKNALETLTQDLGIKASYYIGFFADKTELSALFQLEKANFDQDLTFSESLIKSGLSQESNPPFDKIKQALLTDFEAQELILALYQHDGNQLKTAKAMFIHRNTLTQKIKKFEKAYGLSLSGSDLVLLYALAKH